MVTADSSINYKHPVIDIVRPEIVWVYKHS